jgi:hypothetical protein
MIMNEKALLKKIYLASRVFSSSQDLTVDSVPARNDQGVFVFLLVLFC